MISVPSESSIRGRDHRLAERQVLGRLDRRRALIAGLLEAGTAVATPADRV
ncbi:MAG: hypothetical protein M3065_13830 [Actinomycetota bacterium]|nr:hypothetical protein [Actinomycetota bacterium]